MSGATEGTFVQAKVFGRPRLIHRGSDILVLPGGTILIVPPEIPAPGAPTSAIEIHPSGATRSHRLN